MSGAISEFMEASAGFTVKLGCGAGTGSVPGAPKTTDDPPDTPSMVAAGNGAKAWRPAIGGPMTW